MVGRYPLPCLIGPDTFDGYAQPFGCRFLRITSLQAGGFVDILILPLHGAPSFRVIRLHQAEQFRLSGGPVRPYSSSMVQPNKSASFGSLDALGIASPDSHRDTAARSTPMVWANSLLVMPRFSRYSLIFMLSPLLSNS